MPARKSKLRSPKLRKAIRKEVKATIFRAAEKKYFDASTSGLTVTYAGAILDLCNIGQGITDKLRLGDEVDGVKVDFRMNCHAYASATPLSDPTNTVRLVFFVWKNDATVASPTIAKLFQYNSFADTSLSLLSPYNSDSLDNDSFTILSDTLHQVDKSRGFSIHKKINLRGRKIKFTGTATTGADHIMVAILADDAGVTAPYPIASIYNRFTYVDL